MIRSALLLCLAAATARADCLKKMSDLFTEAVEVSETDMLFEVFLPSRNIHYVFGPGEDLDGPYRITRISYKKKDNEYRWYFNHRLSLADCDYNTWEVRPISVEEVSGCLKANTEKF